jgi:hypothetical protein
VQLIRKGMDNPNSKHTRCFLSVLPLLLLLLLLLL